MREKRAVRSRKERIPPGEKQQKAWNEGCAHKAPNPRFWHDRLTQQQWGQNLLIKKYSYKVYDLTIKWYYYKYTTSRECYII